MASDRGFSARLPVRAGIAALAGALGLAAALFMSARRSAPEDALTPAAVDGVHSLSTAVKPDPQLPAAAPPPPASNPRSSQANIPPEILEAIENGPKEPLTPPVIHVTAELAPGSVPTTAPLVPKTITVSAEPAPGSAPTSAPLVPPTIDALAAPPGR
jgi:hypothetical protein